MKTTEQVIRSVRNTLELFEDVLVDELIVYKDECFDDNFGAIIDCTIVRRNRPLINFSIKKSVTESKHKQW